jgi:hypothetical protein
MRCSAGLPRKTWRRPFCSSCLGKAPVSPKRAGRHEKKIAAPRPMRRRGDRTATGRPVRNARVSDASPAPTTATRITHVSHCIGMTHPTSARIHAPPSPANTGIMSPPAALSGTKCWFGASKALGCLSFDVGSGDLGILPLSGMTAVMIFAVRLYSLASAECTVQGKPRSFRILCE